MGNLVNKIKKTVWKQNGLYYKHSLVNFLCKFGIDAYDNTEWKRPRPGRRPPRR